MIPRVAGGRADMATVGRRHPHSSAPPPFGGFALSSGISFSAGALRAYRLILWRGCNMPAPCSNVMHGSNSQVGSASWGYAGEENPGPHDDSDRVSAVTGPVFARALVVMQTKKGRPPR